MIENIEILFQNTECKLHNPSWYWAVLMVTTYTFPLRPILSQRRALEASEYILNEQIRRVGAISQLKNRYAETFLLWKMLNYAILRFTIVTFVIII